MTKEYYINDAGLQIKNLGLSVFERYRQLIKDEIKPLENKDLYQGEYIIDHARALREKRGDALSEEANAGQMQKGGQRCELLLRMIIGAARV